MEIKHEDGVVRNAFHQQPESFFTLAQRDFDRVALGVIPGDLGIAEDGAGRLADRIDHDIRPEARAILAHAPTFADVTPLRAAFDNA